MAYNYYKNAVQAENYRLKLFKRVPNSYDFESAPVAIFKGRTAGNLEKQTYQVQSGVRTEKESVMIIASNLPREIKEGDRVEFMGRFYIVESIGLYLDDSQVVDPSVLAPEYIEAISPKGITLS